MLTCFGKPTEKSGCTFPGRRSPGRCWTSLPTPCRITTNSSWKKEETHDEGKTLSQNILDKLVALGLNDRDIKMRDYPSDGSSGSHYADGSTADYYGILRYARQRGVLGIIVEHAFIDNSHDWNMLSNESTLKAMGEADAAGIAETFGLRRDDKWIKDEKGWKYQIDGITQHGWQRADGVWYWLDSSGYAATGWKKISGTWYYFDESCAMVRGWLELNGVRFYLAYSGAMATGWKQIDGSRYYFDSTGAMKTGWQTISGTRYYLDPETGAMATGWELVEGTWYHFAASGAMERGWLELGSTWYYLDADTGAMATGWRDVSGIRFYFDPETGAMATGWKELSGTWYYLDPSGALRTGWKKLSGIWFYFHPETGAMATGWLDAPDGNRYYFDASGAMRTGWLKLDGTWYYLDESGAMATGMRLIGADVFYFDASGAMKTGWVSIGDYWFYFEGSGAMAYDKWVGDYYLLSDGTMATDMWIDGYYVGPDGKWVPDKQPPEPGPGPDEPMDVDDLIDLYLSFQHFSRAALIDLLVTDDELSLSEEEVAAAVDAYVERTGLDWNEQALAAVKDLLVYNHMSYDRVKFDLVQYYSFTEDEATYAADNCGADWNEQAVLTIEEIYQLNGGSSAPFSPGEVITLLTSPVSDEGGIGFTDEQAAYAVEHMDIDWNAEAVRQAEFMVANPDMYGTVTRAVISDVLESGLFTSEQIDFAIENADIDWVAQAEVSAKELMVGYEEEGTYYWTTRDGLVTDLVDYYEFTQEEAEAGVDAADIDWVNQASRYTMSYIDFDGRVDGYSYAEILDLVIAYFDQKTAEEGIARCNIDWVSEAKAAIQVLIDEGGSWLDTRDGLLQYLVDVRFFTEEEANTAIDELGLTFDSE